MKCDDLKSVYIDRTGDWVRSGNDTGKFFLKEEVDAVIDELKTAHHKERHEYIEMVAQLKAENKRLKDKLDAANNQCENLINSATDIMLRQDKVNDAKCDELESMKATHYAEMVDAGMRERRLKRALWLARADRAMITLDYFTLKCRWFKDYMKVEPPECDVNMIPKWANVERKCLAKAENY